MVEAWERHSDPTLLRLGIKHGLAFGHDLGQGYRLRREQHFASLDHRQIENLVDQFQQMPSRLENLGDALLLRIRSRRRGRLHQLREAEDRIEWTAELMAHARKKVRLREVGLFCGQLRDLQIDVGPLKRLLAELAFRDVPSGRKHTLQNPVSVVEGRGVVGHVRRLAIAVAHGQLVVGDLLFPEYQLDGCLGPF